MLVAGALHGYAISRRLTELSEDRLVVDEGSLYPCLYRMEKRGWIQSESGRSENNRGPDFTLSLMPAVNGSKLNKKDGSDSSGLFGGFSNELKVMNRVVDVLPEWMELRKRLRDEREFHLDQLTANFQVLGLSNKAARRAARAFRLALPLQFSPTGSRRRLGGTVSSIFGASRSSCFAKFSANRLTGSDSAHSLVKP